MTRTRARCPTGRTPCWSAAPLDGLLLDITGLRPEEIEDGVALTTELGRWTGGSCLRHLAALGRATCGLRAAGAVSSVPRTGVGRGWLSKAP